MDVLMETVEPLAVSVMREGNTICVSIYGTLPDGMLGEAAFHEVISQAMLLAADRGIGFIIEGADRG